MSKYINYDKFELQDQLNRCKQIYGSGILHTDSIFTQSAFIEIMILLSDILQYLKKNNLCINFKDDISGDNVINITDLVTKIRNAACHIRTSDESNFSNNRFAFCKFVGPAKIKIGEIIYGSDYNDDIAFFYGDKKLYLNRHIKRLLEEVSGKINKL